MSRPETPNASRSPDDALIAKVEDALHGEFPDDYVCNGAGDAFVGSKGALRVGDVIALAARLRELGAEQQRLIDDDVYLVRVPGVLVRRMRTLPLQPVTLRIEDRAGRELELIATEHICPSESPAPEENNA